MGFLATKLSELGPDTRTNIKNPAAHDFGEPLARSVSPKIQETEIGFGTSKFRLI